MNDNTDAPGRAGELGPNARANVIPTITIESLKQSSNPEAKAILELIDSATRTAVTEALERIAAGLPEKRSEELSHDPYMTAKDYKSVGFNEAIEAVRAVIAAGGKEA